MNELTDQQWDAIKVLFPEEEKIKGGRPRASNRVTLNGVLWIIKTGNQWAMLPQKYGAHVTAWRRYQEWEVSGLWEKIWQKLLPLMDKKDEIEWTLAFLEGKFVPSRN